MRGAPSRDGAMAAEPEITDAIVDLPDPLDPTSPMISPGSTFSVKPLTAVWRR